jgi:hypothetical protein
MHCGGRLAVSGGAPAAATGAGLVATAGRIASRSDLRSPRRWAPRGRARVMAVVEAMNRERPDLVVLATSWIPRLRLRRVVAPEAAAGGLSSLQAPRGVFAVLDNHDCAYGGARVADALHQSGWPCWTTAPSSSRIHRALNGYSTPERNAHGPRGLDAATDVLPDTRTAETSGGARLPRARGRVACCDLCVLPDP